MQKKNGYIICNNNSNSIILYNSLKKMDVLTLNNNCLKIRGKTISGVDRIIIWLNHLLKRV